MSQVHPCSTINIEGYEIPQGEEEEKKEDDEDILEFLRNKYLRLSNKKDSMDKIQFVEAFGCKPDNFFATRFYELFDQDKEGTIDLHEFTAGMKLMMKGTPQQKLKFLFDVYDADGSGGIDHDELKNVMKHCIEESKMDLAEEALDSLTDALFNMADADNSGSISFEELYTVLDKQPAVLNNLTFSAAKWMLPEQKKTKSKRFRVPVYLTKQYILNNRKHLIWTTLYILTNIGLFLTCIRYRHTNYAIVIARGCGMCLNFNSVAVGVLMLRHTLTWLRMTKLRYFLPIDDHVSYHRYVGYVIVLQSLVHTLAHLVNIGLLISDQGEAVQSNQTSTGKKFQYWEILFTLQGKVGFVGPGFAFISGDILLLALLVMFVCALPIVRQKGYFQVFYFTHLLYIIYWVFLILHGPLFGYMFIIPGLLLLIEKLAPMIHWKATGSRFFITKVHLLPSKVTHLTISKPKSFKFKAGDYIFITIPVIAKFERHPFTISSAPEHEDEFWLHIRSCGSWTTSLYEYFKDYRDETATEVIVKECFNDSSDKKILSTLDLKMKSHSLTTENEKVKAVNVQVYIEGPYGTATREIFNTSHVVLISCGIGVTPYASILQSIMYRYEQSNEKQHMMNSECKRLPSTSSSDNSEQKMKKVEFIWINRDNRCFEWFVSLLTKMESQQEKASEKFLDIWLYMTSALSANDMKGFALQMALDAMQKKGETNVVTGLKSSFKPGRPDWKQLFTDIENRKVGDVGVFFCGNPLLAKAIKQHCDLHGFKFLREHF